MPKDKGTPDQPKHSRRVKSFVIRAGRFTDSQKQAVADYWQDYVVDFTAEPLDFPGLFGNSNPVVLEIGFGMGDSLLELAQHNPAINYLGIEVHKPGIGKLLAGIEREEVGNIRVICHDAVEVLQQAITPESLQQILIYFPDPWPKKRHHKRRLVQTDIMRLAFSRLQTAGTVHLATDWENYAQWMVDVMEALDGAENCSGPGQFWAKPERPETKFERRGVKLGHGVWDLLYRKT